MIALIVSFVRVIVSMSWHKLDNTGMLVILLPFGKIRQWNTVYQYQFAVVS